MTSDKKTVKKTTKKIKTVKKEDPVKETVTDTPVVAIASKSKTTTENIDRILDMMVEEFKLTEKDVRKLLANVLPSTSRFKKKQKKAKDPNAPKRPLTAYMMMVQDIRDSLKKDHPEWSVTDISKEAGRLWREMKSDEKDKYQKKAQKARDDYTVKFEQYKKDNGIVDKVKNSKEGNPDYIFNKESKKYVKRSGKIGQKLVDAEV